jgi:hypothetical protein
VSVLKFSAAAFIAVATVAVAQPDSGSSSSGSETNRNETERTNEKGERVICRMVRRPDTDSLVRGRMQLCLTPEQWRRRRS